MLDKHRSLSAWFDAWKQENLIGAGFECRSIPFSRSREWQFRDGALRHVSSGFFSVVGLRTQANDSRLDGREQVILDQRTPAIIGLALSVQPDGVWSLFQGRIEPGNVGGLQLAPTVQSTKANYTRVHGGRRTSYLDLFLAPGASILYDGMQSEEGSRYLAKYNRTIVNACKLNPGDVLEDSFCFINRDGLRELISRDHCVNTDARSVLACADWDLLAQPRRAFEDGSEIGARLRRSFECRWTQITFREVAETLADWRIRANVHHQILPLDALTSWHIDDDGIHERRDPAQFSIRQFKVTARNREVPGWDQPLVDSRSDGSVLMVGSERDGVLRFWIRAGYEIGLGNGVALAPSHVRAPGEPKIGADAWAAGCPGRQTLCQLRQSEEGGRFYQDVNAYEVAILPKGSPDPGEQEGFWLTLGEIKELTESPGVCSIELRCVCSLLLRFL